MTDSIWLVTRGEYSDYRVICAAPTRELAEEIRDRVNGDDVDELPLLTSADQGVEIISYSGNAFLTPAGVITHTTSHGWIEYQPPSPPRAHNHRDQQVHVAVHAKSPAAALHAVKEYATELASELAAGVPIDFAVDGFNARYAEMP